MHGVDLLGFMAGTLTTLSFVPQVHKAWRTQSCNDLSLGMLLAFGAGILLWLIYGLVLWAMPIILANAVTLALILVLLAMKMKYRTGRSSRNC
jgi:MtN3 and saliva related transmembrane protein